jgi:hypothetical protein
MLGCRCIGDYARRKCNFSTASAATTAATAASRVTTSLQQATSAV